VSASRAIALIHPLEVVHEQHEYKEKYDPIYRAEAATNAVTNP